MNGDPWPVRKEVRQPPGGGLTDTEGCERARPRGRYTPIYLRKSKEASMAGSGDRSKMNQGVVKPGSTTSLPFLLDAVCVSFHLYFDPVYFDFWKKLYKRNSSQMDW